MQQPAPPQVTRTRIAYRNRWMVLREDELERADGRPGLYAYVQKAPAAVVVPRDGDEVWLVEQHRHPVGGRWLELPQGAWDGAPDAAPDAVARGELAEETGLRAEGMEHLGRLFFCPGLSAQSFDVWLATGLRPGPRALEPEEDGLRVVRHSVAEVEELLRTCAIKDAATHAAWALARGR